MRFWSRLILHGMPVFQAPTLELLYAQHAVTVEHVVLMIIDCGDVRYGEN